MNIESVASNWLDSATSALQDLCSLSFVLKVALPVAVICAINQLLNRRVSGGLISNDSWDWTKEIVLITGGNSGMGKAIVQALAQKSIKVVILDVRPPQTPLPPGVSFYEVDVSSSEALHRAAEQIRYEVGDPTVLINNAGIGLGSSVLECTEAQVRQIFDVNTLSHFWIIQEFLPAMIKANHGHVVTMASIASFVVLAGNVSYSCTKASALAFHEGLGQELKHRYSASKIRTRLAVLSIPNCHPPDHGILALCTHVGSEHQ
ncbi:hypothetical protein AK830_g5995 [Neonectria ditissima]|uniref:Ketoreductase domain-containing protein n=1 Tax=Neonectria ditissima TaxID=78410 RepID=A0A0P7BJU9_9HYPO|nr:hypothetical protein AK830_g5995 [Neonectria ditissima]